MAEALSSSSDSQALPREALIATAITFLANKDVQRHPIGQKQQFLRSKGLSETEIQMACERAGVFTREPHSIVDLPASARPLYAIGHFRKPSRFQQFLELINSVAAVSGIAYCVYLFYRKFIKPWLFGQSSSASGKRKTVDECLKELESNMERRMDELSAELSRVREEVNKSSFQNIKSDLDAIKGLLLNKKQFASPIVPPSIPAWQLAASSHIADDGNGACAGEGSHDRMITNDDTGSGSSETEIVTKNSDSSLEIM